ncbi:hypothetical protein [Amycolatopsis sp. lyj-112]|uniref:hypothetical protein n=1 Tax=Amycolatopsis sp. lyj-112 TaxID=2789288 RepID=UPI00397B9DF8
MREHDSPATVPPVLDCAFPDGYDTVLINPAITTRQWRRRQSLAFLHPATILKGLFSAGLAMQLSVAGQGFGEKLGIGLVTLILVLGVWRALSHPSVEDPLRREAAQLPRLRRGEFFRRSDFDGLGADPGERVAELLAGLRELHRSPARAWLDPALPGEVHKVVWRTLGCLDRSRDARALADEVAAEPDAGDNLAAATRQAVDNVDTCLHEVTRHVWGCVLICRAWEQKMRRQDLADRVSHALVNAPGPDQLRGLSQDSDALPRSVFAHITAARDVTHAGLFPWEQSPSEWPELVLLPSRDSSTSLTTYRQP